MSCCIALSFRSAGFSARASAASEPAAGAAYSTVIAHPASSGGASAPLGVCAVTLVGCGAAKGSYLFRSAGFSARAPAAGSEAAGASYSTVIVHPTSSGGASAPLGICAVTLVGCGGAALAGVARVQSFRSAGSSSRAMQPQGAKEPPRGRPLDSHGVFQHSAISGGAGRHSAAAPVSTSVACDTLRYEALEVRH